MSKINAKQVVSYVALPGIVPRIKSLFASGFQFIAFMLAHVYALVRLLPYNHVYLDSKNVGRFGVRHVIAEAASRLEFKWAKWDQVTVFILLISGIVLFIGQVLLLVASFLFEPVFASDNFANMFLTPWSEGLYSQDIVFILMDRIFGVPEFFCAENASRAKQCTDVLVEQGIDTSNVASSDASYQPWPFHSALHGLFRFYTMGLVGVATLIFLYFIVVVVGETATTGTPFGERFQNIWVPLRLVFALLLLTPVAYGFNVGQYITLWVAKAGSSFATNAWHVYNDALSAKIEGAEEGGGGANPLGVQSQLLAVPQAPDVSPLVQAMFLMHSCAFSYWYKEGTIIDDGKGKKISDLAFGNRNGIRDLYYNDYDRTAVIRPYIKVVNQDAGQASSVSYMPLQADFATQDNPATNFMDYLGQFLSEAQYQDVVIYFGKPKTDNSGNVIEPITELDPKKSCGQLRIPIVDISFLERGADPTVTNLTDYADTRGGSAAVLYHYLKIVHNLWFQEALLKQMAHRFVAQKKVKRPSSGHTSAQEQNTLACTIACSNLGSEFSGDKAAVFPQCDAVENTNPPEYPCFNELPNLAGLYIVAGKVQKSLEDSVLLARNKQVIENSALLAMKQDVLDRGWAGAGIWFNKIGQVNGRFSDAVGAIPELIKYPSALENVRQLKKQTDKGVGLDSFNIDSVDVGETERLKEKEKLLQAGHADPLFWALKFAMGSGKSLAGENAAQTSNNVILDAINLTLGTQGLDNMRSEHNAAVHPLAQLSSLGKGIVSAAIRNIGIQTGLTVMGGTLSSLGKITETLSAISQPLFSMTTYIGFTIGLTLYYVLPIMPFIYFFFAMAAWVKGVFEAMVGVPLWAIAHLRIDGEGFAGDAAQSGYFLLLEMFLRPIMALFGLVAAMLIFATQIYILNFIWDMVLGTFDHGVNADLDPDLNINLEGADQQKWNSILAAGRSTIDTFFFSVIYAMIVYMIGNTSFKLIDQIPESILRWAGASVSAYAEQDKDRADQLAQKVSTGGMIQGQKIVESGQKSVSKLFAPKGSSDTTQ